MMRLLIVAALVAAVGVAGCLGGSAPAGPSGDAGDGSATEEAGADGNTSAPSDGSGSSDGDGNATGGNTTGGNTPSNRTERESYVGFAGAVQSDADLLQDCDADRNVGGVCFVLDGDEVNATVTEAVDDATGPLTTVYAVFRDSSFEIRDAGDDDGWFCPPSAALEVPDWAAYLTVHVGDPAAATVFGDCGLADPATTGTIAVTFRS